MYVLDTDHIVELHLGTRLGELVRKQIAERDEEVVATIISVEEIMRGWLAEIHRQKIPQRQIASYRRLGNLFDDFASMTVLPFDQRAVDVFSSLRPARLRIGTLDLKIAAIALANNAIVASSNIRDFGQVPVLVVEDWLER